MKKILSLLLAALLTAGSLAACSESGENKDPASPAADTPAADVQSPAETEAETEVDRAHVPDNLPELDFKGATTVIHSRGDTESVGEVAAEELTGEAVSDSVYERNNMVSERLNVKIEVFAGDGWENYNSTVSGLRSSIMEDVLEKYLRYVSSISSPATSPGPCSPPCASTPSTRRWPWTSRWRTSTAW